MAIAGSAAVAGYRQRALAPGAQEPGRSRRQRAAVRDLNTAAALDPYIHMTGSESVMHRTRTAQPNTVLPIERAARWSTACRECGAYLGHHPGCSGSGKPKPES